MPAKLNFREAPVWIVRCLVQAGFEAYIVGGAVRDMLLGRTPKDYDITTSATPEQVRAVFGRRHCRIIGRRFRLALVFVAGEQYEVSTFRSEPTANERCSRQGDNGVMIWNDNHYGTFEDDVTRRDFTVNALYANVAGKEVQIIDKVDGLYDLKHRIVKCLGDPDTRFQEDPVRMLRALKLVGQSNFTLDDNVCRAIDRHASKLSLASSARLFEELNKIFFGSHSLPILSACHRYGLLAYFWPALEKLWDTDGGAMIQKMFFERDRCLSEEDGYFESRALALATPALPLVLATLFEKCQDGQFSRPKVAQITAKCLRELYSGYDLPRELSAQATDLITDLLMITKLTEQHRSIRKYVQSPNYEDVYELLRLLTMAIGFFTEVIHQLPYPDELTSFQEHSDLEPDEAPEDDSTDDFPSIEAKKRRRKRLNYTKAHHAANN